MNKFKGNLELNWINKDKSLYYEYDKDGNPGKPIWVEKNDIRVSEPRILKLVKEYGDVSGLKDPLDNALIRGDNLLALRTLVEMFKEREEKDKVKCVYIDPPYNTGNDGFIYDDNMKHSEWLTMMRDRLILLKKLLRNDGLIFLSIDDNENHRVRILMDEIFGPSNFIANLIWKKRSGGGYTNTLISTNHEYLLVYGKDRSYTKIFDKLKDDAELAIKYPLKDNKSRYKRRDLRKSGSADLRTDRPTMFYPIKGPDGIDIVPIRPRDNKEGRWSVGEKKFKQLLDDSEVEFVKKGGEYKIYLKERPIGVDGELKSEKWESIWDNIALNSHARNEIKELFPENENAFDYPKPINLIKHVIKISTDKDDIILDSFAGSGTTGHSVFELNDKDISSRRFILIELIPKIADKITSERLHRAIKKIKSNSQTKLAKSKISFGFRYYKLGESLLSDSKMNWNLTYEELSQALFMNFDYIFKEKINNNTFIGKSGKNTAICIVTKEMKIIKKEELQKILDKIKNNKTTKITIFTNHGIAIKNEDLPDNITIKKIPESILRKYKL